MKFRSTHKVVVCLHQSCLYRRQLAYLKLSGGIVRIACSLVKRDFIVVEHAKKHQNVVHLNKDLAEGVSDYLFNDSR